MEYIFDLSFYVFQGMDAESYSLHTFEALLTQSMENLGEQIVTFFLFSFFLALFPYKSSFS